MCIHEKICKINNNKNCNGCENRFDVQDVNLHYIERNRGLIINEYTKWIRVLNKSTVGFSTQITYKVFYKFGMYEKKEIITEELNTFLENYQPISEVLI